LAENLCYILNTQCTVVEDSATQSAENSLKPSGLVSPKLPCHFDLHTALSPQAPLALTQASLASSLSCEMQAGARSQTPLLGERIGYDWIGASCNPQTLQCLCPVLSEYLLSTRHTDEV
jgi:hypothetical protein